MNQEWIQEWQEGELDLEAPVQPAVDEAINWMRSRPDSVKAMMRKFPPSCLVRSIKGASHFVPAPGTIGVLRSYIEPGDDRPNGELTVTQYPNANLRAACSPDTLEVVGYYKNLTPELVDQILAIPTAGQKERKL